MKSGGTLVDKIDWLLLLWYSLKLFMWPSTRRDGLNNVRISFVFQCINQCFAKSQDINDNVERRFSTYSTTGSIYKRADKKTCKIVCTSRVQTVRMMHGNNCWAGGPIYLLTPELTEKIFCNFISQTANQTHVSHE